MQQNMIKFSFLIIVFLLLINLINAETENVNDFFENIEDFNEYLKNNLDEFNLLLQNNEYINFVNNHADIKEKWLNEIGITDYGGFIESIENNIITTQGSKSTKFNLDDIQRIDTEIILNEDGSLTYNSLNIKGGFFGLKDNTPYIEESEITGKIDLIENLILKNVNYKDIEIEGTAKFNNGVYTIEDDGKIINNYPYRIELCTEQISKITFNKGKCLEQEITCTEITIKDENYEIELNIINENLVLDSEKNNLNFIINKKGEGEFSLYQEENEILIDLNGELKSKGKMDELSLILMNFDDSKNLQGGYVFIQGKEASISNTGNINFKGNYVSDETIGRRIASEIKYGEEDVFNLNFEINHPEILLDGIPAGKVFVISDYGNLEVIQTQTKSENENTIEYGSLVFSSSQINIEEISNEFNLIHWEIISKGSAYTIEEAIFQGLGFASQTFTVQISSIGELETIETNYIEHIIIEEKEVEKQRDYSRDIIEDNLWNTVKDKYNLQNNEEIIEKINEVIDFNIQNNPDETIRNTIGIDNVYYDSERRRFRQGQDSIPGDLRIENGVYYFPGLSETYYETETITRIEKEIIPSTFKQKYHSLIEGHSNTKIYDYDYIIEENEFGGYDAYITNLIFYVDENIINKTNP